MWPFRRRNAETPPVDALMQALQSATGHTFEMQAKSLDSMGRLLETVSDISAKRAAQALGSRGGKVSQERRRAKKAAAVASPTGCRLCRNPMAGNLTIAEIDSHRMHGHDEPPAEELMKREDMS